MGKKHAQPSKKPRQRLTRTSTSFPITLTQNQRDSLLQFTRLKSAVTKQLAAADEGTQTISCKKSELDHMQDELAQAVVYARSPHKQRLVAIQKKVDRALDEIEINDHGLDRAVHPPRPSDGRSMSIQLKIMLLEVSPPIWRRIQVADCTLDELHEYVQLAMGWEDQHMHRFTIEGERYGTPMPDDFEMEYIDETQFKLSDILPKSGKRFRFRYEYDFGDGWQHEVLFEGYPPIQKGKKLPFCLEGERACPPEDIGGPWGYAEYLDALADPNHDCHDEFLDWGCSFDPEAFVVEKATRAMRKGLPTS